MKLMNTCRLNRLYILYNLLMLIFLNLFVNNPSMIIKFFYKFNKKIIESNFLDLRKWQDSPTARTS